MTFGGRAVLSDVKNGGLRRDLSLAFEMDSATEAENTIFFNEQVGEFVAVEGLSAPQIAKGMPMKDRFYSRTFPARAMPFRRYHGARNGGAWAQLVVVKRLCNL